MLGILYDMEGRDVHSQKDAEVCAIEALSLNSSELRAADFKLREVFPLELEAAARCRSARRGDTKGLRVWVPNVSCYQWDKTEFWLRCE